MSLLNDFTQLLFPSYCAGCERLLVKGEVGICISCQFRLPRLNYNDHRGNKLEKKLWGRADIYTATAFLQMSKSGMVHNLIHELKYHDNKNVGIHLGKLFGASLLKSESMNHFDFIIPVPLHPKKLFKRGYNQCDCIAEGMCDVMNIETNESQLLRLHHNTSQTKKSRYKRWENVDGIFALKDESSLENKHVLLIDDVITTGATIEACAHVLNKIKGLKLSVGAIAIPEN